MKNEYNNTNNKKMEEIMGYRIGFDIGSTTIKAVVLDENNQDMLISKVDTTII